MRRPDFTRRRSSAALAILTLLVVGAQAAGCGSDQPSVAPTPRLPDFETECTSRSDETQTFVEGAGYDSPGEALAAEIEYGQVPPADRLTPGVDTPTKVSWYVVRSDGLVTAEYVFTGADGLWVMDHSWRCS